MSIASGVIVTQLRANHKLHQKMLRHRLEDSSTVRSTNIVRRLFERVNSDAGRLDILVNNVNGDELYEWKPFWEQSLETGFRSMERGVNSHLITIHAALPF